LGHKVHPNGFRLGVIRGWESRWFANRNYKDLVLEDAKLREAIRKRLFNASVSRIEIERVAGTQISIAIHTAKPGIVIGKSGESVERLRQHLEEITKKKVRLSILEIRNPEVDAYLVARSIAEQIEKRVSFRRAMKQAVQKAMRAGAKGIKVIIGGRLGGAEIARSEKEVEGSVPLQTLRANIDYGLAEAHTTYGVIGVKVWIYHGDILPERQRAEGLAAAGLAAEPVPATGERGGGMRDRERGGGMRDRERGGGMRGERGGERGGGRPATQDRGAPRSRPAPRGTAPSDGGADASRGPRGQRPAPATGAPRGAGRGRTGTPRAEAGAEVEPAAGPEAPPPTTVESAGPGAEAAAEATVAKETETKSPPTASEQAEESGEAQE
jgi:small subunit ribosomal protein S3